jgi:replicative DNA helicase
VRLDAVTKSKQWNTMAIESISRRPADLAAPPTYRSAPHNIEAEQALLGAILVNNEALYRVTDFLEPQHFFEPIHQQTYDVARSLIRTGKLASPVTLKTLLPAEIDIAGLTLAQYLARLAAEATTIINAVDYGRTIYDLAIRRELINIGEDMVNVAFDASAARAAGLHYAGAEARTDHAQCLLTVGRSLSVLRISVINPKP